LWLGPINRGLVPLRPHHPIEIRRAQAFRDKGNMVAGIRPGAMSSRRRDTLWVPKTSSTSCDQAIFVDQASDVSLFPDAVVVEIDWLG